MTAHFFGGPKLVGVRASLRVGIAWPSPMKSPATRGVGSRDGRLTIPAP